MELEVKLQETRALLQQKQEHLKSLESDIQKLEVRFEQAGQEQKDLKIRVDTCTRRVKHAEILLKELGGERDLWFEISQKLSRASETVLGDMFILAAIVAYSGSSLPNDRRSFSMFVQNLCRDRQIPFTDDFSIKRHIGDQTEIARWKIAGLPDDSHHIENAIIMKKATLWPLLIDPHGLATGWIKNMYKDKGLLSQMLSEKDFMPMLETAVEVGTTIFN